jgi:hypothetical protein
LVAAGLLAVLATACTNSDPDGQTLDEAFGEDTSAEPEQATPTTPATPSTDPEPEPDLDTLAELWQQLWTAASLPNDERLDALESLTNLDPEVIAAASNDLRDFETADAYTYPNFVTNPDGTVNISDCTIYQPIVWDSVTHLHLGIAEQNPDNTWTITEIARGTTNCVPNQIADPALNDYANYADTSGQYWNPPDPNHPGLEQVLTDNWLEVIRPRLQDALDEGIYLLVNEETSPEIAEVFAPDWILVTDCRTAGEGTGIYNNDGTPSERFIIPTPGNRFLYRVEMTLTDGTWKASRVRDTEDNSDCKPGPSLRGLEITR